MCCENCCTSDAPNRDEFDSQVGAIYTEMDYLRKEREEVRKDIYTRIAHLEDSLTILEERLTNLEDHVKFGTKPR